MRYTTSAFGETFVAAGRFVEGNTVNVTAWNLDTGATIALSVTTATEIPGSAISGRTLFRWLSTGLTVQPTVVTQIIIVMQDATTGLIKDAKFVVGGFPNESALLRYRGEIVIDPANGTAGTAFPTGTREQPATTFAFARTISDQFNLPNRFVVKTQGTPLALKAADGDFTFAQFEGVDPNNDLVLLDDSGGAVNVAGARFRRVGLRGDQTGAIVAEQCNIGGPNPNEVASAPIYNGLDGLYEDCGFEGASLNGGKIVMAPNAVVTMATRVGSSDIGLPGGLFGTIIDFGDATAKSLIARDIVGFWRFRNIVAGDVLALTAKSAQITLEATVTGATAVIVSGEALILDSSSLIEGTNLFSLQFTPEAGEIPPLSADIADAVWDELTAGHVVAGSYGEGFIELLNSMIARGRIVITTDPWTEEVFEWDSTGPPDTVVHETYELFDQDGVALAGDDTAGNNPLADPTRMIAERRRI